ncbi:MAG: beta-N-acetylhexosaminidase [Myxococcales bacterium]|nr:beta-N-acetylhexosaminidase [Myxococcales bacterium]
MSDLEQMKRRIGQRVIFGFPGTRIPTELAHLDEEWGIGGYVLFTRNLENFEQLMDLTEELWTLGQGTPPFIGIDHEGGPVHRLPAPFTVFPDMAHLGQVSSVSVAYEVGAVIGRELTAAGFNLNFAPVLDLNTNPDNPIIGRRAISDDPDRVASLARAVVRGLHDNAIIACGKHFPGHGDTHEDSHLTLPVCDLDLERLRERELLPYRELIQKPPHLDMVMTAHVMYPKVDAEHMATTSRYLLQDVLRLELGFKGLVVTDDLEMKAVVDRMGMEEVTIAALEAGVDLFLVCHDIDRQVQVLETLLAQAEQGKYPKHLWERGYRRVRDLKARHFRVVRTVDRQHARELVGNREHIRIARRLKDGK